MDIKTYRAKTMRDALELVRRELGPSGVGVAYARGEWWADWAAGVWAADMRWRRARMRMCRVGCRRHWWVRVPLLKIGFRSTSTTSRSEPSPRPLPTREGSFEDDYRARYRDDFRRQVAGQLDELHAMVEKLCDQAAAAPVHDLPEAVFRAFTDLIEAEVDESIAREWIDEIRREGDSRILADPALAKVRVVELLENEIKSWRTDCHGSWEVPAGGAWLGRRALGRRRRSRSWRRIIGCGRSGELG